MRIEETPQGFELIPELISPITPPERGSRRWKRPLLITIATTSAFLVMVLFGEVAVDTAKRLNTGENIQDIRSMHMLGGALIASIFGGCGYFISKK